MAKNKRSALKAVEDVLGVVRKGPVNESAGTVGLSDIKAANDGLTKATDQSFIITKMLEPRGNGRIKVTISHG